MNLNQHLAEKVMGWETRKLLGWNKEKDKSQDVYWWFAGESEMPPYTFEQKDWNPSENIEQAIMVAAKRSKVEFKEITMADLARVVDIGIDQYKPLALAICISIAKATGWEEEQAHEDN